MKKSVVVMFASAATLVAAAAAYSQSPVSISRARFTASGEAELPIDYREWHHVGTRYKGIGISIIDGETTKTPEIYNAYVEPHAMAVFEKTGQWPDGTQMVKEFSAVKVGEGCDEKTLFCTTRLGQGIFETGYMGLGMMVKDVKRFPDAPGNWGYFSFGHKPPPYDPTSPARSMEQCGSCHVKLASDTDYVISAAHIGLNRPIAH